MMVTGTSFQCLQTVKSSTSFAMASLNLSQSGCFLALLRCMVSGSPVAGCAGKGLDERMDAADGPI